MTKKQKAGAEGKPKKTKAEGEGQGGGGGQGCMQPALGQACLARFLGPCPPRSTWLG